MKRIISMYLIQQVNVLLLSFYFLHQISLDEVLSLQIVYLLGLLILLELERRKHGISQTSPLRRVKWMGLSLLVLFLASLAFSLLVPSIPHNQEQVIQLERQLPTWQFFLFLLNASIAEEVLYRQVLWQKIPKLNQRLALTTVLFALAHYPTSLISWCLYGSMGLILGIVRHKTDIFGSIGAHTLWNSVLYCFSLM